MIRNRDGDAVDRRRNDGRCVIGTAFELLDHVCALEPVRLLDLAEATGIPGPTLHQLLKQLIEVGAVRREGTRYRLGASLLELGARVTPERRLRAAARRPLAELAAATGAAVSLSATIGGDAVFLDTMDARVELHGRPGGLQGSNPELVDRTRTLLLLTRTGSAGACCAMRWVSPNRLGHTAAAMDSWRTRQSGWQA